MGHDPIQFIFMIITFLCALGIIIIIYSRNVTWVSNRLFIIILVLVLAYLVSHSVHFLFMYNRDVTFLDNSCHSFLLLIIVTLTFFTWNYPRSQKMGILRTTAILLPSIALLIFLWTEQLIQESHVHHGMFEAHYTKKYPLYLVWYIILIVVNVYWIYKKRKTEINRQERQQLALFLLGMIITNLTSFIFGLFLPWVLGFYFLVEMSPLAFLIGLILFTAIAIGRYNMFPVALERANSFTIKRKMFFSALIIVPIIVLLIQIPLGRFIFDIKTNVELSRYFLISLFVGIIVSISITFIIMQVISNPLNKLREKVIEIESGNYGSQVELPAHDELGELALAFNNMSITLMNNSSELREKENRISLLLSAFENATASIVILDSNYVVVDSNNMFCDLVKKKKVSVLGEHIKALQFAEQPEFFDRLILSLSTSNRFEGEFEVKIENEETKQILISATHVTIGNKEFSGYLFVELDITERKKLELQLAQSEKLAALGKMAAVLAHEIKTPLTSIKLNTDMLIESLELNNEDQKSFNIISKEINRLNNLVKEVLQLSRQPDLNYSVSNIRDIVENIILETQNKTSQKAISLINKVESIKVEFDNEKIKQVLLNLIDNSIESINESGTIELTSSVKINTNKISIFIKDSGCGINDSLKIFEPFYTTKSSGTGLGLSISQKIIEQHKGILKLVSSKPGETIFEITLPLTKT